MEISEKLTKLLSLKKRRKGYFSGDGVVVEEEASEKLDQHLATACLQFFSQKVEFVCVDSSDSHLEELKTRYKPLNKLLPQVAAVRGMDAEEGDGHPNTKDENVKDSGSTSDEIPKPRKEIYNSKNLVLEWKEARRVGVGLSNMGNTCFLNSVLQCLVYTPPLYNYITSNDHKSQCNTQGFCVMCEFQRHIVRVFNATHSSIKPIPIVQNLKAIAKPFRLGRQEDAHEFLRYFVDGLQKSCLQRFSPKLDPHSKATTVIHKIFGGYHRSQVKCLECLKTSDTFDPLLDINLDIKNCPSLSRALQKSIQSDTLEGENSYACPFCKKMTRAQKKFTIHRLPNVMTIQLKRFEYNGLFGGKINKSILFDEYINLRPYMSHPKGPPEWYKLYAVLVHLGYSSHSGHYYSYIRNSNNTWYCMNDAQVTQVGLSTVLSQEAYLLFYIKDSSYKPSGSQAPPPRTSGTHPAPRTTSKGNNNNKVKPDPNFLGVAIKRPPNNLDKTGTPLVKTSPKPTGIVNPSPHASSSPATAAPAPTTGHKIPSPTVTEQPLQTTPQTTPPGGESATGLNGSGTPIREFSIPLKKAVIPLSISEKQQKEGGTRDIPLRKTSSHPSPSAKESTPKKDTPSTAAPLSSNPVKPEPKKAVFSTPIFTPRQIVAPAKSKKALKTKKMSEQLPKRVIVEEKAQQNILSVKSIAAQSLEEEKMPARSLLDIAEDETVSVDRPAPTQPGFVALSEETAVQTPPTKATMPVDREMYPLVPVEPPSHQLANLHMTPFSLKQKIAMVSPLPHSGTGMKPVARVKPSLHLSPSHSSTKDTPTPTPSTPHMNATSPWMISSKSPSLPEGKNFNTEAHGWKVTTEADNNIIHTTSKSKKKKKKHKKYRIHSPPDYSTSESDSDRKTSRRESSSRKRGRYDHSDDDDYDYRKHRSSRGRNETPTRYSSKHHHNSKKHKKHHRHDFAEERRRDYSHGGQKSRERGDERRKKRHHSHRSEFPLFERSPSSSDSDSKTSRHRSHYHYHHHHHSDWAERKQRVPDDNKGRRFDSSHRHHKHKQSLSPWSGEEKRKRSQGSDHEGGGGYGKEGDGSGVEEHASKRSRLAPQWESKMTKGKKLSPVPEVEWDAGGFSMEKVHKDSAGGGGGHVVWDGAKHSSTVDQLTSHSLDKLGSQVESWVGGTNSIDSSTMEGQGEKEVRDSWDRELDRGKVKKVKKKVKNDFSSGQNLFQHVQNQRNKLA